MGELGGLFGQLIIACYIFAMLNFAFKFINRNFGNKLKKYPKLYTYYLKLMKFFVKNHRYFGMAAIVFIFIHAYIQYNNYGVSITGFIAAIIMLLQIGFGMYAYHKKKNNKLWINLHKALAFVLLFAIIIHVS